MADRDEAQTDGGVDAAAPSPVTEPETSMSTDGARDLTDAESRRSERYFTASQTQLMVWRFRKHRVAVFSTVVIGILYLIALFAEPLTPYPHTFRHQGYVYAPPSKIHFVHEGRFTFRPFVYALDSERDPRTLATTYIERTDQPYFIRLFVRGDEYRVLGLFRTSVRLFGVKEPAKLFLFGTDALGKDMFSRTLFGTRISLSIGLIGVVLSLVLGTFLGGISGYYGGRIDNVIQRSIEIIRSFPRIPLWMGLSAAVPKTWTVLQVYFAVTVILSLIGWTSLARVIRGKVLATREMDFVRAARIAGVRERNIITRHILPLSTSHLIVTATLAIPDMILAETALSFLGIGLRSPATSWGVLLQSAQNLRSVAAYPWMLIPILFVIVTVLAFNFFGDGWRDAADPYSR